MLGSLPPISINLFQHFLGVSSHFSPALIKDCSSQNFSIGSGPSYLRQAAASQRNHPLLDRLFPSILNSERLPGGVPRFVIVFLLLKPVAPLYRPFAMDNLAVVNLSFFFALPV